MSCKEIERLSMGNAPFVSGMLADASFFSKSEAASLKFRDHNFKHFQFSLIFLYL